MSERFRLAPVGIALPPGAFSGGGRDLLTFDGAPLCAFTRARFRPCLHPVWTPSGQIVTAERPADHPHHSGIWIASDHVGLLMQGPDGIERYDYCFYVDDVFQGRAPGRIVQTGLRLAAQSDTAALVEQKLDWIGPAEWGADAGRPVLTETRWTVLTPMKDALILDVTCEVTPAGEVAIALGPTRHAWFNARVADALALQPDSAPVDNRGNRGAANIAVRDTARVAYSGPVGGDAVAGISVIPDAAAPLAWFVADWGVITTGAIRDTARTLHPGETTRFACRFVAHDGVAPVDGWDKTPFAAPEHFNGSTGVTP